jgi:hypothetical protein
MGILFDMEEKQFWFVCYEEEFNHRYSDLCGKQIANGMIDYSPWEFAATYTKKYGRENRFCSIVILWAHPISQEEFEQWKDHF